MTTKTAAAIEPRLLDMNAICIALSCSRPQAYGCIEDSITLDTIMHGRRRFATPEMIDECIERRAQEGGLAERLAHSGRHLWEC
jgi:hypothetical protein